MLAKILGALVALTPLLVAPAAAVDAPPIFVGGQFIREHAVEIDGHLLVPVRGVFEAFHARVAYTPPRIVVVRKSGSVIAGLVVGRRHAVVANRPYNLAVAPIRFGGRVFVPLRIIAEIAGATVVYSAKPRLVDIRLPFNELPAALPRRNMAELVSEPAVPVWAYTLVACIVLGFVFEFARRLAMVVPRRRSPARATRGLRTALTLQLPNAVGAGDQHAVGEVAK